MAELRERYGVNGTTSNPEAVASAALVVVAVKPQDFDVLLGEVGGLLQPGQTVLSVAAAIPTAAIEGRIAQGVPVVRAMPNAPSTVHEGIAGICAGAHAGDAELTMAEEALSHLGPVVRVAEKYMDAVTAVSGSGPAYFALLAEAMIEAGILLGLSREISTQLVVQTMLGTREAAPRRAHASRRAAGDGHLPRRHDDQGDPRAGARRRARGVPERDPGRDGALERTGRRRRVRTNRHTSGTEPAQSRAPFADIVPLEGGGRSPTRGGGSLADRAERDMAR